jgi:hypothetical protein
MTEIQKRPGCVTAYAILLLLGAGICGLFGVSDGAASAGIDPSMSAGIAGGAIFGALLNVVVSIGLFQLKNWARILVLISTGLGIAYSVLNLISVFLLPAGSSAAYLPSSYYNAKAMSLIVGFIGLIVNSTIFDWFKKNGKYFVHPKTETILAGPGVAQPTLAPIPVPAAPSSGFRLATPDQQEGNIQRIKQWCGRQEGRPIKVNVISSFGGRESVVTSAHGKLLDIEEHPTKRGVYRMRFDSHLQGLEDDAVALGYEISGVEERGNQLIIYKATQRIELFAGIAPKAPHPLTRTPWPQIPGYRFETCFNCRGNGGTCKRCEGYGKYVVREPAQRCPICHGNGFLMEDEITMGPECEACRGIGWQYALRYSDAVAQAGAVPESAPLTIEEKFGEPAEDIRLEATMVAPESPVRSTIPAEPISIPTGKSSSAKEYLAVILFIILIVGVIGGIPFLVMSIQNDSPAVAPSLAAPVKPSATFPPANTPNYEATSQANSTRIAATEQFAWVSNFAQPILDDVHNRQPNFEDDFSDRSGRFVRWSYLSGDVEFVEGIMRVNTTGHDGIDAGGSMNAADFVLKFEFTPRIVSDGSIALASFRWKDDQGYVFDFSLYDIWWGMLAIPTIEEYRTIAEGWSPEASLNRTTSVIIIARGNRFAFYANGKPLLYAEDSLYQGDWVGIGVWSPNGSAEVDFDNVKFWDLNNLKP